jgi:CRP-like cAMP-binding protein
MLQIKEHIVATRTRPGAMLPRGNVIDFAAGCSSPIKLVEGWAASFLEITPGCRQITAFHLPGDLISPPVSIGPMTDLGAIALTDLVVAPCDQSQTSALEASLRREKSLVAWMVCVARREAIARIAHLLCELQQRLSNHAGVQLASFKIPLHQEHIADATGMTPVHANRMIRELNRRSMAQITSKSVMISDLAGLQQLAGFDGRYLDTPAIQ